jgi:hypothetical protein
MRSLLVATLAGVFLFAGMTSAARAQGTGTAFAPSELGAVNASESSGYSSPLPVFSSPAGPSQGYGFYPAMYWTGAGAPLYFRAYTDGTVSHPHRPGSINILPIVGYFAMGDGPFIFPKRQ